MDLVLLCHSLDPISIGAPVVAIDFCWMIEGFHVILRADSSIFGVFGDLVASDLFTGYLELLMSGHATVLFY